MIAGTVNAQSLELMAYVFFGGMAGVVAVRRADRLQSFLQAGIAVFIVNVINQSSQAWIGTGDSINTQVGTAGYPAAGADEGVTVSASQG